MALTPSFTATQQFGTPSNITLTDTSTGSDVSVYSRRVYIQLPNGKYLVQQGTTTDYEPWNYSASTITLDVLTGDAAVTITVEWLNVSNVVLYTVSNNFGFTGYGELFDYGLTQMLTANPTLINDNSFFMNKLDVRVSLDSGNNALALVNDLYGAQMCYDRVNNIRKNSQYYFNINS
jgi:hypothetical protein